MCVCVCVYTHNWITLMYSRNNIVNQICMCCLFSCVRRFVTPWIITCQAPLSMGFSRHEYWGGLPFSPPGESSRPRDQTRDSCLLHWQAGSLPLAPPGKPPKKLYFNKNLKINNQNNTKQKQTRKRLCPWTCLTRELSQQRGKGPGPKCLRPTPRLWSLHPKSHPVSRG